MSVDISPVAMSLVLTSDLWVALGNPFKAECFRMMRLPYQSTNVSFTNLKTKIQTITGALFELNQNLILVTWKKHGNQTPA